MSNFNTGRYLQCALHVDNTELYKSWTVQNNKEKHRHDKMSSNKLAKKKKEINL